MELDEVKKLSEELIENSIVAYLSTVNSDGFPMTRALLNLRYKERYPQFSKFFDKQKNKYINYFSTNTSSSKMEDIHKNPNVSVYFCDPDDFKGVMLGGEIEIVDDIDIKREFWTERSIIYYPKGLEDPDYTIFRFNPKNATFYYKLQQVKFELSEK